MSKAPKVQTLSERVFSLRERIASLQREARHLRQQTRSPAEVAAQISAQVDAWSEQGTKEIRRSLLCMALGQNVPALRAEVEEGAATFGAEATLGPVLAMLLGADALKERLVVQLDAVPACPDTADRLARLEAIGEELDSLEQEEESAVCEAELSGEIILRRGDARPDIVLGPVERVTPQRDPSRYLVTTM
jgi:hypothetical protein